MEVSIRQLKEELSGVIRKVRAGETVTVRVRNRPVARIVPIAAREGPEALRRTPGIAWKGGKPAGLWRGERLRRGAAPSDRVSKDRR